MNIELKEISIKDLFEGYDDNGENGIYGYNGKLDIRPPFQREFVYGEKERNAVINTVTKNYPLNVMYWAVKENNNFEIIDGQQRTVSICQYLNGDFAFKNRYFANLQDDEQNKILGYNLMVYFCSGTNSEKLEWFKTINIAGKELTNQELRNAVYSGSWVTDARKYFSKTQCPAYRIGKDYISGKTIRQEYLEKAISWISSDDIKGYMGKNQHEPNASELWLYFQSVINWVEVNFPTKRKKMKLVDWGILYNQFKDKKLDAKKLEKEVARLMMDDDVTNKKGIYTYVLTKEEKYLNIRPFSDNQKIEAYERQKGVCPICKKKFKLEEMEADHIIAWSKNGKTSSENCQMLCKKDNREKSNK